MTVKAKTFGDELALVTLSGNLTLGKETQAFRKIMQDLVIRKYKCIVIDLGEAEKIDCAGLGELVRFQTHAREVGTTIALQNLPRRVEDLLVITRLVGLFDWLDVDIPWAA